MAKNDVVLLDSIAAKLRTQFPVTLDESEYFELFCFDQLLKDYELSYDELASGQVDGGNDGGIDGFFTFLNGSLLNEVLDVEAVRRNPTIELYILTVKHGDSFRQTTFNSLLGTLPEIFNFQRETDDLIDCYNESVLSQREIFRQTYINLVTVHPSLKITVTYACRGDTASVPPNVTSRAEQLRNRLIEMFSDVEVSVELFGASELLHLARQRKTYSLRLRFIENYVSREKSNYVLLSRLDDYFRFVSDESGNLRRYLFEYNVRDYLGQGSVNREIAATLNAGSDKEELDFWWLNNGITILASSATVAGKELSLENVQIVNGLQTTESVHRYMAQNPNREDERAILIKVVVITSDEVRTRIIKATNHQSTVETASLRATDKIQRDIEHLLEEHGWFYDRRKNLYKNQGHPADRIVSVSYLGATIQALILQKPWLASEQRTRYMKRDEQYKEVFNNSWDIHVFLVCLELVKDFDRKLRSFNQMPEMAIQGGLHHLKFIAALAYVVGKLQTVRYRPDQLCSLQGQLPTEEELVSVVHRLDDAFRTFKATTGRRKSGAGSVSESPEFAQFVLEFPSIIHEL